MKSRTVGRVPWYERGGPTHYYGNILHLAFVRAQPSLLLQGWELYIVLGFTWDTGHRLRILYLLW